MQSKRSGALHRKKTFGQKIIKFFDDLSDRAMLLLFILLLALGSYALIDTFHVYYHAQDASILKYKPQIDENGEVVQQTDLDGEVAWLTIDGTNIDYPVMQGEDNTVYLNKDPYGNFSLSGSLFLDYRNASDFTDDYSLIYGHHMEHEAMFGALDEFKNDSYLQSHNTGTLYVGNVAYKIKIFACLTVSATDERLFNPSGTTMQDVQNAIGNIQIPKGRMLALSTCQDTAGNDRTMVLGILEE